MKILIFLSIFLVSLPVFAGDDICERMKSDYKEYKRVAIPIKDVELGDYPVNFLLIQRYLNEWKLDKAYEALRQIDSKPVALKINLAELQIYFEKYDKALIVLNKILKDYPKHIEAKFLKEKAIELKKLEKKIRKGKSVYENKFKKSAILRDDLFFPDKSLDILRELLSQKDDKDLWLEIAKSINYYQIISLSYPYKDDIILRNMKKKKMEEYFDYNCNPALKNTNFECLRYFRIINSYLVHWYDSSTPFLILYGHKRVEGQNIYYVRKYVSGVYVSKVDLGNKFYEIISLTNSCNFENLWSCVCNTKFTKEISEDEYLINFTSLFLSLQENYFNFTNWKGPYFSTHTDDQFGYDYMFYENKNKHEFRVFSCGPNWEADLSDLNNSDNIGYVIKE